MAIIGMLITILLPSLTNAREKARSAVCMANLTQQHVAMTVYAQEEGVFPTVVERTGFGGSPIHWASARRVKIKNTPFECPSDYEYGTNNWEISYGFNHKNLAAVKPVRVNDPSETILTADSGHNGDYHPWKNRAVAGYMISNKAANPGPISGRHLGTANILWVDGHVTVLRDIIDIHLTDDKWDIE